ncbi:glycoside hydrolase family 3 C-terminal domain-containing protein [uncultured Croceicoccus sp.]|uniref:glycoside hydrolase family 3 C-terminal domain-containing protein n=1 Tax=uncultured Croceicoccus sp. TaxID=1295329 RepID=UPI00262569F5|nr:glycoside hydrolase family 3 C-terminal domain-containing protein [uncultured Croceicoccus sp.]
MMKIRTQRLASLLLGAVYLSPLAATGAAAQDQSATAAQRAETTLKQMTEAEKTVLTVGILAMPFGEDSAPLPEEAVLGAGYIPGIARLDVPALTETDASLGISWIGGLRGDGATALPAGLAMASTWNRTLIERGGQMIGAEARAKGFNVLLAGGVNLLRDPRNGRNFEYLGEDPLLAGTLVGHSIRGVQSNDIIATIKHLALNGQETGRKYVDSIISEDAAYESDLLAFKIGIEIGNPGAVMCAYNRVNGEPACGSAWLMNDVLKQDWGYKGFVMSDWGAVPGLDAALAGLDQQSGSQLDTRVFFGDMLARAAHDDPAYARRLDDMNRRILWAMYYNNLDTNPVVPGVPIDFEVHADIAQDVAEQGIVLLRNRDGALPLAARAQSIAVIGGYADSGVLSGAGSSQVQGKGGPAISVPLSNVGPTAAFITESYHASSPLAALRAQAPDADITYRNGRYISEAVAQAKKAEVAIVFATQWASEGYDQPDLTLPNGQDALIAAVADAQPNTIVVLETGGPVLMPWLDKTAAVIEAWYPGARGGEAIASVIFGKVNPSGRLPITFPAAETQWPRSRVDGADTVEPEFFGNPPEGAAPLRADYDIEGSDVGYRWFARQGQRPLFAFGHGLSYTDFESSELVTDGHSAKVTVRNTGDRDGATVVQLYLTSRNGEPLTRLAGFERVELAAGETRTVTITIDSRILAERNGDHWQMPAGRYRFDVGSDAQTMTVSQSVTLPSRTWPSIAAR